MNTLTEVPGYKTLSDELKDELAGVELDVLTEGFTLADAMREGSKHTGQAKGTYVNAEGNEVCALSAAALAVKARFDA